MERNTIPCYGDYSNDDPGFLRNRIRLELLPAICAIEPALDERIFRTVGILQEEYDYFRFQAQTFLNLHMLPGRALRLKELQAVHPALARHVIREYIRRLKGNLQHIDFVHIEAVRLLDSAGGLALPGLNLLCHKGYLLPADAVIPDYNAYINGPGHFELPVINRMVVVEPLNKYIKPVDNWSIVVPAEKLNLPLTVRPAQREDHYRKINCPHRQTVFEAIRVSGLPAELRHLAPVFVDAAGLIIWVYGAPVADAMTVLAHDRGPFTKISLTLPDGNN